MTPTDLPPCCQACLNSTEMRRQHRQDAYRTHALLQGELLEEFVRCHLRLDMYEHMRIDHGFRPSTPVFGLSLLEREGRVLERMSEIVDAVRLRPVKATQLAVAA